MRESISQLIRHRSFDWFILFIILINSIALAMETAPTLSKFSQQLLAYIDISCITIFVIEAILKLFTYRLNYFKSGWNVFDFIIVVVALLPFSHFISVLRALRILRAFRLVAYIPSLKRVVNALAISIPGLISTACLLLLVFFVFGVMGVKLFGHDFPQWFGHLGMSMFSLFQIMTLESWSMGIVRPIMEVYPYAWIYFIPFILISAFTLLNFLIGIVVDSIAHLKHDEERKEEAARLSEMLERLKRIETALTKGENSKDKFS
jgi:voltage-gated sodium channel